MKSSRAISHNKGSVHSNQLGCKRSAKLSFALHVSMCLLLAEANVEFNILIPDVECGGCSAGIKTINEGSSPGGI